MDNNLFYHINIPKENINFLNGNAKNPLDECENYEKKIKSLKGLDCQILGIGVNGHIAFCEPYSAFDSKTSLVKLSRKQLIRIQMGDFLRMKMRSPNTFNNGNKNNYGSKENNSLS